MSSASFAEAFSGPMALSRSGRAPPPHRRGPDMTAGRPSDAAPRRASCCVWPTPPLRRLTRTQVDPREAVDLPPADSEVRKLSTPRHSMQREARPPCRRRRRRRRPPRPHARVMLCHAYACATNPPTDAPHPTRHRQPRSYRVATRSPRFVCGESPPTEQTLLLLLRPEHPASAATNDTR